MKIKVKLFGESKLPQIIDKGDWIDLRSNSEDFEVHAPQAGVQYTLPDGTKKRDVNFHTGMIELGIAMKLPKGFEAIIVPRSSTFNSFGIMCRNSFGVIDNTYCGNRDQWKFPFIAMRDGVIQKGDRICQFRIQLSQKATPWQKIKWLFVKRIEFVQVANLDDNSRGGFGSTGAK